MEKIYELLNIEKLDEAKQDELKIMIETLIESKVAEKVQTKLDEGLETAKTEMIEQLEEKFENYKEDLVTKFSNFVDDILKEELVLPENIVEYARLGEQYHGLVEQFKVKLAIDEGVLDDEVKGLLKEAKDKIIELQKEKDSMIAEKLDLEVNNEKMSTKAYLMEKCEGLTDPQTKHICLVLEGADKEEIDKKFDILVKGSTKIEEEEEEFETMDCPECGEEIKADSKKCPKCEASLEKKEDDDDDDDKKKKKKDEDDEDGDDDKKKKKKKSKAEADDEKIDENSQMSQWKTILRNGTF